MAFFMKNNLPVTFEGNRLELSLLIENISPVRQAVDSNVLKIWFKYPKINLYVCNLSHTQYSFNSFTELFLECTVFLCKVSDRLDLEVASFVLNVRSRG